MNNNTGPCLENFYSIILLCIFNLWAKLKKSTALPRFPHVIIPIPFHELEEREKKRGKIRKLLVLEINFQVRQIFLLEKFIGV